MLRRNGHHSISDPPPHRRIHLLRPLAIKTPASPHRHSSPQHSDLRPKTPQPRRRHSRKCDLLLHPALRSSSLSLVEKLLLPLPGFALSLLLLSLSHALRNRPTESATSLLRIFHSNNNNNNASLARSKIAPALYERLFSLHLFPVFRWFNEQRTKILSSTPSASSRENDYSVSEEYSVVLPCAKVLSKMSEEQAAKLREVEREYEEVLEEYFKEVLVNKKRYAILERVLRRSSMGST